MTRNATLGLAGLLLLAACSKTPANTDSGAASASAAAASAASTAAAAPVAAPVGGPAVSGAFTANGKAVTLTQVTAHKGEPFDDQPVTELVFTEKDQGGDADASTDAVFRKFGDAIVVKIQSDGTVIGTDVVHSGLKEQGSVSLSGMFSVKNYQSANGQISGELTSGGPTDVFGQPLNVDLTFHVKAP